MQRGDYVRLTSDIIPWYSGYGSNPHHVLRAGEIGRVTHTNGDLVSVTGKRRGDVLARFQSDYGEWQAELWAGDYVVVNHHFLCHQTVCNIACPIGD